MFKNKNLNYLQREGIQGDELVIIRKIKIIEIIKIHKLYNSLSKNSKDKYHSIIYGYPKSIRWFAAQLLFIVSLSPSWDKLVEKRNINFYHYHILGIFDKNNHMRGFGHIVVSGKRDSLCITARLGIAVSDKYQNHGYGNLIISELISIAKQNRISKISLDVLDDNLPAQHLYLKYGFVKKGIVKRSRKIDGICHDIISMELNVGI